MSEYALTFNKAGVPDVKPGDMRSCIVACRSRYDGKVRTYPAVYLNKYPLVWEDGPCPECPGDDCPAADTGECPTTGWYDNRFHQDYDNYFEPVSGEVIAWADIPTFQHEDAE